MRTFRSIVIEAALASAIVVAIAAVSWPETLGMTGVPLHPAWIAVIALAARYGVPGLFVALPVVWAPLGAISYLGSGGEPLLAERVMERVDLVPLVIAVVVAWITISQQNKHARLAELLDQAEAEVRDTRRWGEALEDSLAYLRDRCDRIDSSLSFWRRLSERLERGDVKQASGAALELALNRTGASAGCVELLDERLHMLAHSNGWISGDLSTDSVAARAAADAAPRLAHDLDAARPSDCDIAIPVLKPSDGAVIGLIALRGVDPTRVKAAELSDLSLIADWLAPQLATKIEGPRLRPVNEELA